MINQKPPRSPCVLNKTHPHAKNLTAAFLFNDYGLKNVKNYVKATQGATLHAGSIEKYGYLANANFEYCSFPNTNNSIINSNALTVICYIRSIALIGDSNTHVVFGEYGASPGLGDFLLYKDATGKVFFLIHDSTNSHYIGSTSVNYPNWNTGFQLTAQANRTGIIYDNSNMAINIDGDYITPSTKIRDTSWNEFNVASTIGILNDSDYTTRYFDGYIDYMYIYNKVLPVSMLKRIYKKPYAMFET